MTIVSRLARLVSGKSSNLEFVTVDTIVARILKTWSKQDLEFVKSGEYDMGMIGRQIRNDFGLWGQTHPLTTHWHLNPECREIIDGVDYSENHPDQVAAAIVKELRRCL